MEIRMTKNEADGLYNSEKWKIDLAHQIALENLSKAVSKLAKEKGLVFESLEELAKAEYPNYGFKEEDGKHYIIFEAGGEEVKIQLMENFYYHKCPNCGYVPGPSIKSKYNELGPLSGSAGDIYSCKVCHKEIEKVPFIIS